MENSITIGKIYLEYAGKRYVYKDTTQYYEEYVKLTETIERVNETGKPEWLVVAHTRKDEEENHMMDSSSTLLLLPGFPVFIEIDHRERPLRTA